MKTNKIFNNVSIKLTSLVLAIVMLATSGFVSIALDNTFSLRELTEQTFTLTPEKGVTVTLHGLMPKNGSADAKLAEVEGEDVLHAYDISIYYADGGEFEPASDSPINVSFQSKEIKKAIKDENTTVEVEHIADNGEKEEIDLSSAKKDKQCRSECFYRGRSRERFRKRED